jgi:hypothetical protein
MHVHTEINLPKEQVASRFEQMTLKPELLKSKRLLHYEIHRNPPKMFVEGLRLTLPPAAEVAVNDVANGSEVVLRLMWGPLPAPFPRCLAIAGIVAGALLLAFAELTVVTWIAFMLVTLIPLTALYWQKTGEENLKSVLSAVLDGASFTAKPH